MAAQDLLDLEVAQDLVAAQDLAVAQDQVTGLLIAVKGATRKLLS